jgi:alanine-synthesizing transaminase
MRLLVNPGEKILIPKPSYPLFQFLLEINDVHFDYYPLGLRRAMAVGLARPWSVWWMLKPRPSFWLIPIIPQVLISAAAELNFLNEFCSKHQIAIISDEVFFDYAFIPGDFVSCAGNQAALTFVLGGLSKTLGLPQMKCAWILASGPQEILQESLSRLEIIADTYLSVNTPVQNALGPGWNAPRFQGQIIARVKENWQWLISAFERSYRIIIPSGRMVCDLTHSRG